MYVNRNRACWRRLVVLSSSLLLLMLILQSYETIYFASSSSRNLENLIREAKHSLEDSGDDGYKIICYLPNWSTLYYELGKFLPEDINPHLCTHIIFSFGLIKRGVLAASRRKDKSTPKRPGYYERVQKLKLLNPKLKIILAVGARYYGAHSYSRMAKNYSSRKTFIESAIDFLRAHRFNGLNIEWHDPVGRRDKANLVSLLKELSAAFENEALLVNLPRLLITASVPVDPAIVKKGFEVAKISKYLDFVNLMTYDLHDSLSKGVGHNAPLYPPSGLSFEKHRSVALGADSWTSLGFPKKKILMGIPTYGKSFTLAGKENCNEAPAKGPGLPGLFTRQRGLLAYYEVCLMLRDGGIYVWDEEAQAPFAIKKDLWVSFVDERAVRKIAKFIKNNGFGGATIRTLHYDDFMGEMCKGVKYPLVTALGQELRGIKRDHDAKDIDWLKKAPALLLRPCELVPRSSYYTSMTNKTTKSPQKKFWEPLKQNRRYCNYN